MIIQTAKTVGALPALEERSSWLSVDVVANACVEITFSTAPSGVMETVNHESFHWSDTLVPLFRQAGLDFDAVP